MSESGSTALSGVVVCLKWVATRPDVDPLTGEITTDPRFSGASAADQTALEYGLRIAAACGEEVTAITVAGSDADPMLRDALAAGAARAVRLDPTTTGPFDSSAVAAAIAKVCTDVRWIVCGDYSLDRGTGSVPAFLAAELGAAQALGLMAVDLDEIATSGLRVTRRLDQGRREELRLAAPAVLSVEASIDLRRASLSAVLSTRAMDLEVHSVILPEARVAVTSRSALRPRARVVPPPRGSTRDRLIALSGVASDRTPPQLLELDPDDAADVVLDHLRQWGYLES